MYGVMRFSKAMLFYSWKNLGFISTFNTFSGNWYKLIIITLISSQCYFNSVNSLIQFFFRILFKKSKLYQNKKYIFIIVLLVIYKSFEVLVKIEIFFSSRG